MIYLLHHRRSRPTGSAIAEALGVAHGDSVPRETRSLIRWGSRAHVGAHVGLTVLNNAAAIDRASDKLRTLSLLREAGVRVPDWSTNPEELEYPFLGRRIHHARGTDIVLCLQRSDWTNQPRDYYVKYVPTKREVRVHVVDGQVIRIQGKFRDNPALAAASPWIRNYQSGYRFRAPNRRLRPSRTETAIRAVAAFELDFGAVDIAIGDDDQEYVFEVNTAPACSPLTAGAYVTAFQRKLKISSRQVVLSRLDLLAPNQDDGDTDDEVEGEEL